MHTQGRRHQVWSGQVRSACASRLQLGVSGGMKFLEFRGYEIPSETIFEPEYDASRRPETEFHMYEYLPIASYSTGFGFPIVH